MALIRDIRVVALEYSFDPDKAYGMARGVTHKRGAGMVLLETDQGVTGIGEAWGPPRVTAAYLDVVKPFFIGKSVFAQRAVAQTLYAKLYHFGTQNGLVALVSGIDIAAHDAMGKLLNVSVADLIGGRLRERVPAYCSGGYFTATGDTDVTLQEQLEPHVGRGFPAFKIKIGRNPAEDEKRVALARRIIGDDALLTVDSNGNYTVDGVLESMRRIAGYGINWYEEPLAPQDWKGYAELKAKAPIPVATGEALYTVFDLRRLIDGRLADVIQPDLALCGGLDVARTVGILCGAEHLRLSPHVWGTGIGLAAAVHFVAALPSYPHAENVPWPTMVEYDIGDNKLQNEIFEEPIKFVNGHLEVPKGPGLGVRLNMDAVKKYTVE
ncbi:MAG: mandelate racemase/muconate lactonizing enzyme family protein [Alphaproteobacteria bacterium]